MCLNIGTPKNINFAFETNGKWMALGVPILKHFRVYVALTSTCVLLRHTASLQQLLRHIFKLQVILDDADTEVY